VSKSRLWLGLALLLLAAGLYWRMGQDTGPIEEAQVPPSTSMDGKQDVSDPLMPVAQDAVTDARREESMDGGSSLLRGRVRSKSGAGVAGARVVWLALQPEDVEAEPTWPSPDWGESPRTSIDVLTESDGSFAFTSAPTPELPFGSVLLALHRDHFAGGLDLGPERGSWPTNIVIELEPSSPIEVQVVDAAGKPQLGAIVHHVAKPRARGPADPSPGAPYERFLAQQATTDGNGNVWLAPFRGEQALWARKGELQSVPWQGPRPVRVRLRLGETFSIGGTLSLPHWDARFHGERRILVSGWTGNLWRPIAKLRAVQGGEWGPLFIPLEGISHYKVRLEGAPIVPIEQALDPAPAGAHRRIDFVAEKQAELWFEVRDESGNPIPSAKAVVWWKGAPTGATHVEGAARPNGRIWVGTFPPGWVQYRITAPGFAAFEYEAEAPSVDALGITMHRGGGISGRCTHDGKPVEDFQVIYWHEGSAREYREASFFGREDGAFDLDNLEPGEWSIHAASPRFPSGKPVVVRIEKEVTAQVQLDLPTAIRGGGRVVDQDGKVIASARVQAYSSGGIARSFPWGPRVVAAADGTFELEAFVPGANYLSVEADGFSPSDVERNATDTSFLDWGDIRLFRPQALDLALVGLEEWNGVDLTSLRARGKEGALLEERTFSAEGLVQFEGVAPGDHQVFVTFPDNTWTRLDVRLDPGKDWSFDLKLAGEKRLAVQALDPAGESLSFTAGILVSAQEENGLFVVRAGSCPRDGPATFAGLRATRAQVWVLDPASEVVATRDIDLSAASTRVEIRVGEEPLRVRVLDVEHAPLLGAWVTIRSADGREIHAVDDTDSDGQAELFGVPEGMALMDVAHGIAGKCFGVPVDPSVGELEFVLEAKGALELKLVDGDLPLSGVAARIETSGGVTLSDARQTDDQGVVRFEPLGEGSYHLACRRGDCWPALVDRSLAADERALVSVQMRRLGDLELTVFNREGLPVSDLELDLRSKEFDVPVEAWLKDERVQGPAALTTDALGKLRLQGLPHGTYTWSVSLDGEPQTGSFTLEPAKSNQVRVTLR